MLYLPNVSVKQPSSTPTVVYILFHIFINFTNFLNLKPFSELFLLHESCAPAFKTVLS